MATKAERPKRGGVEFDQGSREGRNEKPSAPKCSEGLRKSSKKLEKLFSSFLRGASCPKSPRVKCNRKAVNSPQPQLYCLCLSRLQMSRAPFSTETDAET